MTIKLGVILLCVLFAACGPSPRRVTTDDGSCSVVMPDAPKYGEESTTLTGALLRVRSWGVTPDDLSILTRPTDMTAYILRRATAPNGTSSVGPGMLDEASRQLAMQLAKQNYETPSVRTIATPAGSAVEVRSKVRTEMVVLVASRFFTVPNGYCEVSILGARSEADITAFFDTVSIRP
jgi:hypothetical protein